MPEQHRLTAVMVDSPHKTGIAPSDPGRIGVGATAVKYLYIYRNGESNQVSAKTRSWARASKAQGDPRFT